MLLKHKEIFLLTIYLLNMSNNFKNILIADRCELLVEGVANYLRKIITDANIYCAKNDKEGFEILKKHSIDIFLMELVFEVEVLLKIKEILQQKEQNTKLIALTQQIDLNHVKYAIKHDMKLIDKANIKQELQLVLLKNDFTDSKAVVNIKNQLLKGKRKNNHDSFFRLTKREEELLTYFGKGLNNHEILALKEIKEKKIVISAATLDKHRSSIYRKLKVNSAAQLVYKLSQLGII